MAVLAYATDRGSAYWGDTNDQIRELDDSTVNLIMTSPPFALRKKKSYGNPGQDEYLQWFAGFANDFHRVLTDDGSLVIEIGGTWNRGEPTRSIYHFELLTMLVKDFGFHLAEDFYWYNRAKLPSPAQWVTVERIRAKDAVTPIWWLSKTPRPKADNRKVLTPYSDSMKRLLSSTYNRGKRPSGHIVGEGFTKDHGGAIPPNLLVLTNTRSNDLYQAYCRRIGLPVHPARFPSELPEFFIRMLTDEGDLVFDPFAGSNSTGQVAERLNRRWIAVENDLAYVAGSVGRFPNPKVCPEFADRSKELLSEVGNDESVEFPRVSE